MNDDDPALPDELVCHCMRVSRARLLRAIREEGARSVDELRRLTRAGAGCQTCWWDLNRLLEEEERGRAAEP